MAEDEWVDLVHPETDGEFRTTRDAFETTWEAKGWQLAPSQSAAQAPTSARSVSAASRAEEG